MPETDRTPAVATASALSAERLDELLQKTSRTFALSIPELPEPTRRQVGLAYLLFRIADTFEDAEAWAPERQVAALRAFVHLLEVDDRRAAFELARASLVEPPSTHAGYLELLGELPEVMASFWALDGEARTLIGEHTRRTALGMAEFVARRSGTGVLELASLEELAAYCYVVAGIVGEMLTELFLLARPQLAASAPYLRQRSASFGEALQLVNILKDAAGDETVGRRFLPAGVAKAEVFAQARRDLTEASAYVRALQSAGAPRGLVAFTALPVRMAVASLERVEEQGPGAKLSRPEVAAIAAELARALAAGEAAA